jgi:hypothetical protein
MQATQIEDNVKDLELAKLLEGVTLADMQDFPEPASLRSRQPAAVGCGSMIEFPEQSTTKTRFEILRSVDPAMLKAIALDLLCQMEEAGLSPS